MTCRKFWLGLVGTCRDKATLILTGNGAVLLGVNAVLQSYYHVLQERRHQARQTTLLSYFKRKSEELPTEPNTADDPVDPIHSQSIPLIRNAYVFIFYYRINVI
jgi:hypothetical protein